MNYREDVIGAATLRRIQREHRAWVDENFGDQPAWAPLLGMVEEYGESMEAMTDRDAFFDAVGDFSIFLLHYVRIKGWDATMLWSLRHTVSPVGGRPWPVLIGRIAHCELKVHQKIRGSREVHEAAAQSYVVQLFAYLEHHCRQLGKSYVEVVEKTWAEVKRRNWNKHREEAEVPLVPGSGVEHS